MNGTIICFVIGYAPAIVLAIAAFWVAFHRDSRPKAASNLQANRLREDAAEQRARHHRGERAKALKTLDCINLVSKDCVASS